MIDTDKYEGHTPAPWGRDCDCIFEYDGGVDIARIVCWNVDNEANAQLIADAPLLLAEVKRLREKNRSLFLQLSEAQGQLNAIHRGEQE